MPPKSILVVDDERRSRSLLKSALRERGYRVLGAASGLEALAVCACRPIDLLLAKPEMPGIDGRQLAEALARPFPGLPVLYFRQPDAATLIRDVEEALAAPPPKKEPGSAVGPPAAARARGQTANG
ncbi:MAG: response regulator [Acidobacteriota bacterium]